MSNSRARPSLPSSWDKPIDSIKKPTRLVFYEEAEKNIKIQNLK
jgi:hypothetical protein